jgi:hypothetical protein
MFRSSCLGGWELGLTWWLGAARAQGSARTRPGSAGLRPGSAGLRPSQLPGRRPQSAEGHARRPGSARALAVAELRA